MRRRKSGKPRSLVQSIRSRFGESQMETMTDIVEKVAELPSEAPKPTASAIVEQRKASAQQNFNNLAQAIQTLKNSK